MKLKKFALLAATLAIGFSPALAAPSNMLGGAKGVVKTAPGEPLEGIMVQLGSKETAIRTTVYSDQDGHYEFPKLNSGIYTLRIARPREFEPYVKENVTIDGAAPLDDIALTRVTPLELLPPRRDIAAQMTGSEWLLSLSGSGEEKKLLTTNCNFCHSYQQIFRNRYDEHGWTEIVNRMTHGAGSPLILRRAGGALHRCAGGKTDEMARHCPRSGFGRSAIRHAAPASGTPNPRHHHRI